MSVANTTRAVNITPPQQAAGRVVNLLPDGSPVVECEGRGWHCRRAASCLLTPALGDNVLVAGCATSCGRSPFSNVRNRKARRGSASQAICKLKRRAVRCRCTARRR